MPVDGLGLQLKYHDTAPVNFEAYDDGDVGSHPRPRFPETLLVEIGVVVTAAVANLTLPAATVGVATGVVEIVVLCACAWTTLPLLLLTAGCWVCAGEAAAGAAAGAVVATGVLMLVSAILCRAVGSYAAA